MRYPSTDFYGSGAGIAWLYLLSRCRVGDIGSLRPRLAFTYLNLCNSSLGRKGLFRRYRRLQRIWLPDCICRQSEAPATSSKTGQMQGDTGLLLGSCARLQEALAGRLFARWAISEAWSRECRNVHFSNQSSQTRRRGNTRACRGDVYFGIVMPVSATETMIWHFYPCSCRRF